MSTQTVNHTVTNNTTRKLQTRHYGVLAITAISVAITVLGGINNNIPTFSQYLSATAIPDIITILDWILARAKDSRGLGGISIQDINSLIATVEDLKNKFPTIAKPTTT